MAFHPPFSVTMLTLAATVVLLHVLSIHGVGAQNTSSFPTTDNGTETTNITATGNSTETTNITATDANDTDVSLPTTANSTGSVHTTSEESNSTASTPTTTTTTTSPTTTTPRVKDQGANCSQIIECRPNLNCTSGKCNCNADDYYDASGGATLCKPRKYQGANCSLITECRANLNCTSGKCNCNADDYYDASGGATLCKPKQNYKESCNATVPGVCKEANTTCTSYPPSSTTKRCLCAPGLYRTDDKACISESNLIVTQVKSNRSSTFIVLYWTSNSKNSNVTYVISHDGGDNVIASSTGGNVTGLTPGTQNSFKITSTLPADDSYLVFIGDTTTTQLWTYPAKPGKVDTVTLISNPITTPFIYAITFGNSTGAVSYEMNIAGKISRSRTNTVTFDLIPAASYNCIIKSFNENNDTSEPTADSFTTKPLASGPVEKLNTTEVLESKANIKWQTPSFQNGNITGYLVQVQQEAGGCLYNIKLKCDGCTQPLNVSDDLCTTTETANSTFDSFQFYHLELPSLKPYHYYNVVVLAVNEEGKGQPSSTSFTTDIGAANKVEDLQLISFRNESTGKVNLNISWTAGDLTGPTNYSILVQNETKLDTDMYSTGVTSTVTGYSNTNLLVEDVLAYWQYNVYVTATTSKGDSVPTVHTNKTERNKPGQVQSLSVIQDNLTARKLSVTFLCPEEQERNGIITRYVIRQTDNNTKAEICYNQNETTSCKSENSFSDITNIEVEHNYLFDVKVINDAFEGDYGQPFPLHIETKVPRLDVIKHLIGVDKLVKTSTSAPEETSIAVEVCSKCLTDNSQGEVTQVGLIICVPECNTKSRKKRSTLSVSEYFNYPSWHNASRNNFKGPYRTTPDDWIQSLKKESVSDRFTIGSNTSCGNYGEKVYCNGPLPAGAKFSITVVVCTSAGCDTNENGMFGLKVSSSAGAPVGAIVGGVLGGLALVALITVIIIVLYRQRAPKEMNIQGQSNNLAVKRSRDADLQRYDLPVSSSQHVSRSEINDSPNDYIEVNHYDYIDHKMLVTQPPPNVDVVSRRHLHSSREPPRIHYPYENTSQLRRQSHVEYENYL